MLSHDNGRCDLVIVGASFAGLVAARTAAMRGLNVVVLEAKPDAGARVATTGILVKEATEEVDLPHNLMRRIYGVRLYAPNLRSIDLFSPGTFFLTTDTAALLRWLAHEAMRAGARIRFATRFVGAERDGSSFRITGTDLETRYILGADGSRSAVARHFGLGRNEQFLVGVEAEFEGLEAADPRFLHCFLDRDLAPGYLAWVAPAPRLTQVGLAARAGRSVSLSRFLARGEAMFRFSQAQVVERRAGRIPCGGLVRPWAAPGVLLIGDAAGMVSPATGGGIRLAFQFGRRAAQAIADHLLHLGPSPETVLARELPRFGLKRLLRMGLDIAPPNIAVDALIATAPLRWLAAHVYFHRRSATGISFSEFEARIAAAGKDLRPARSGAAR
jgi:digeranylgeranylglycerophospholipid reductase